MIYSLRSRLVLFAVDNKRTADKVGVGLRLRVWAEDQLGEICSGTGVHCR